MIDTHYDLLSVLYLESLKNDFSYSDNFKDAFNDDNVKGIIANLYFMNPQEMKEEFEKCYDGEVSISVIDMFKKATTLYKERINKNAIFSIEGCDYIKDTNELEELSKLGLKNILLVWNNENKYGSGPCTDKGLTEEGKNFIKKAIDLGLSIDLSHANVKTFWGIIDVIKEQQALKKEVKVIVSHSNCYELCNHKRNLTDEQIKAVGEVGGIMSLVAISPFVKENEEDIKVLEEKYIEHIRHAVDILGVEHVSVGTDDMDFVRILGDEVEGRIFDYKTVKSRLETLLKEEFSEDDVEKIMYKNIENKLNFRRN